MSTQVKTGKNPTKNGNSQKAETAKATAKPQIQKSQSTVKDFLAPSAQDKIQRAENFAILAKKYAYLKEKRENLDRFMISSDGTKEQITMTNAEGFDFQVTNTQVIEKVVDTISAELQLFLDKSEQEIVEFTV